MQTPETYHQIWSKSDGTFLDFYRDLIEQHVKPGVEIDGTHQDVPDIVFCEDTRDDDEDGIALYGFWMGDDVPVYLGHLQPDCSPDIWDMCLTAIRRKRLWFVEMDIPTESLCYYGLHSTLHIVTWNGPAGGNPLVRVYLERYVDCVMYLDKMVYCEPDEFAMHISRLT